MISDDVLSAESAVANKQLQGLKERLSSYSHPLEGWLLDSTKQSLLKARKRNKQNPWKFVLPNQPKETISEPVQTAAVQDTPEGEKVTEEIYQEQLRERDNLKWLNTLDDQPMTMEDQLKGKFLVVDFWTSCCINCIHVLAELEELETKFKDFPEVAFIGVHSAKFDKEEAAHMLRQAIIRYDVTHACINDCKFDVWNTFKLNNWPTILLVGPDGNIIQKMTEERNVDAIEHLLYSGLSMHADKLERDLAAGKVSPKQLPLLNEKPLPLKLEKEKAEEQRQRRKQFGISGEQDSEFSSPETITALRQNLSQPGKLILIDSARCPTLDGQVIGAPLPYEGVSELLVVSDSSHNRLLLLDAATNTFLEQIGSGKGGYREGAFDRARFSMPQGMCHFLDSNGDHCLMVCDVKNHLIRLVNLNTKQVKHVAGLQGVRGCDTTGGEVPCAQQELASPWDIALDPSSKQFYIVMAGTHQIWRLDLQEDRCYRFSGSGAEGNANQSPQKSTWAQPSGLSLGRFNGETCFFIADSESSAVRAVGTETKLASCVAGANDDELDLFDFGDKEGASYEAKLQHPLGVHYCEQNQTLYVADTYNHKIKTMASTAEGLTSETPLLDWIGNSREAMVRDGPRGQGLLNEPNACFAKLVKDETSGQLEFAGLYIADTGNDCIRFAQPDGKVETMELVGVPDVRTTASDCSGAGCTVETIMKQGKSAEAKQKDISAFWAMAGIAVK